MSMMSTANEPEQRPRRPRSQRRVDRRTSATLPVRATVAGKFLQVGRERFWIKGVTYGTFAPDAAGRHFPPLSRVSADFASMRRAGVNTVRTYTVPDCTVLDLAADHRLRVMVGVPWTDHVAFLNDRAMSRTIRRDVIGHVRTLASHPAVMLLALGNEIPAAVVRWLGPERVERFLAELYADAKAIAPERLFTYVNYPPTEYLNLPFVDLVAFNVYLHRERDLRAYLARLQNVAGHKPLLVAEAGADSSRAGVTEQATLTAMQLRAAFAEGACGAVAFAWTDEWWRGGHVISDWAFGLVDAERRPKPVLHSVADVFSSVPLPAPDCGTAAKVSVVVCAYNAADTLDECLTSLEQLTYPDFEVIVVNDGSGDRTGEIARQHPFCRVIDLEHGGLSHARNAGLAAAAGDIVAYTDADVRVDPHWLTYLVQPFLNPEVVAAGGLSLPPLDSPWMAHCVARAPGGPTHVLLDDRTAEHVPGCNLAVRREALQAIGGFNPIYLRAGDDVDVCWRLQATGGKIEYVPAALVWHHHRATVRGYWQQQVGYGEGEAWLVPRHRGKFTGAKIAWKGHIYSPLPFVRSLSRPRVNVGVWGTAAFPSVYHMRAFSWMFVPHTVRWQIACAVLVLAALVAGFAIGPSGATPVAVVGLMGLAITVIQCVRYALASDIEALPNIGRYSRLGSRAIYRVVITSLHLLQPFARATGYVRGVLRPPRVAAPGTIQTPRPTAGDVARALYLLGRGTVELKFWSERWIGAEMLLTQMADRLHGSPLTRTLEIEECWLTARDIRVALGRFGWLDLLVLVENHGAGRSLVRVGYRFQPAALSIVAALALVVATILGLRGVMFPWAVAIGLLGIVAAGAALWRGARAVAAATHLITELSRELEMQPMSPKSEQVVFAAVAPRGAGDPGCSSKPGQRATIAMRSDLVDV
jgi:O-antigen biosynthesis protein